MPDSTKLDRDQSRLRILFAFAVGIAFLTAVRYAMLAVAQFSAGIHHTALGSVLVMGVALLCLAGSLLLWARPGWSETALLRYSKPIVWFLYAAIALPALIFSVPEGWDEARHILYGMHLRGYSVSGDPMSWLVVRSPMASFLSALVYPFTQIINPILFAFLVFAMASWCRTHAHPAMMIFAMLAIVANDHFMQAIWAVMGELPGALFLVTAFGLLARERFALCAVCFALAVLSRWNLAPFALIGVAFVGLRVSLRQALLMAVIGATIFGLWFVKSWYMAGPPWELLKEYATHAHAFTDGSGPLAGVTPTLWGRLHFYSAACYFQTLPGLVAIVASFFIPRVSASPRVAELLRFWIPSSLLLYFFCITLTGGYFPRLAVVTFPLTLLVLVEVIWAAREHAAVGGKLVLPIMIGLLPISAATSVERYDVAAMIGRKILQPPPLPPAVALAIREHTDKRDIIIMPRFYKVSRQSNGRHLRAYVRRDIRFFADLTNPSAELMFTRTLEDEIRDFEPRVDMFTERMPEGTYILLPDDYRDHVDLGTVLIDESGWILARMTE